jgi:hypothetical protein
VDEVSLSEVRRLVDAANAVRRQSDASGVAVGSYDVRAERRLDALFGTGRTLAVYGTLAPGRPNHLVLEPLGRVDGRPDRRGPDPAGVGRGPRLSGVPPPGRGRCRGGEGVDRPSLATAWPDLDRFEGPGYRRILCRYSARSLAPGRRASGGCARLPTSIPRTRPVRTSENPLLETV